MATLRAAVPAAPLLALVLAGCLAPAPLAPADLGATLPQGPYYDAAYEPGTGYHTLEDLEARIDAIAALRPDLVRIEVLGESREGRPLRALVIENRQVAGPKPAPFIDGGHHANEVEGIEATVFLAEYLVANHATNATVRALVDGLETWILPLVNPDGYVVQTRFNAAGVNLNRNYDLDWCDPAAYNTCAPQPAVDAARPLVGPPPEHAGAGPFSEPESSAVRDAILALGDRLAFYVSHHTPAHCIARPWTAPNPPFPVPGDHLATFDAVFAWVRDNTEYGAGRWTWLEGECMSYSAGGSSQDWVYATARKPTFTMEVAGSPAWEGAGLARPEVLVNGAPYARDLAHWNAATLPIELLLLHNAAKLQGWQADLAHPPLPEGAPPAS